MGRSPSILIENKILTGKTEGRSPEIYTHKGGKRLNQDVTRVETVAVC